MPLDMLITGRIATLAGDVGFGWVEAIGIRDGRIAFAGSEVDLETRADPHTERIVLEPDQVALPGLTDAHLHLVTAGLSRHRVDLTSTGSIDEGLAAIRAAHEGLSDGGAWLEGHGWDADRWGRWPTAADLARVAPGRRAAIWAHDHHALLASREALATAAIDATTPDPPGGLIRRAADGVPEGVLHEAAARLVMAHVPPPTREAVEDGIVAVARDLVALGVVACHDPGGLSLERDLSGWYPAYASLADAGRLPLRVHACVRQEVLEVAIEQGLRSGAAIGENLASRARVGWQKVFADGSLGSRTAALLADIEPEPGRPVPPDQRRGIWMTPPDELVALARRAADAGIATQIHAIGDAAVRAALDALEPVARVRGVELRPRIEHVQLVDPADVGRFAAAGIVASVQPVHLRSDAAQARMLWGDRAERSSYAWASLASSGAVVAFGTDAPVEPYDPWPGIALAVRRADPSWPAGTPAFGPQEALLLDRALRAACVDPAVSAGELDRGRLTVGQRADVVVMPAATLDEPVEPGGAPATARPDLVLIDGEVVFDL